MNRVVVEAGATLLNELPHIKDATPIGDQDAALLAEVREVLQRHGALGRFGLQLLHKHYDLNEGEILHEVTDEESRTSNITPISENEFQQKLRDASITYTTVFFPDNASEPSKGVVAVACLISCSSHRFGKVHNVV